MSKIKKMFLAGALIIAVGVGSMAVYADSPIVGPDNRNQKANIENRNDFYGERNCCINENWTREEREEFCKERRAIKREELNKAVENKEITEEEAKEWEEHFNYMEDFRDKQKQDNVFEERRFERGIKGRNSGFCGNGMGRMRGNRFRNQ